MGGRRGDSVGDNTGYDGSEDKDEGGKRGRRMNGSPRVEFLQLRVHAFEFCSYLFYLWTSSSVFTTLI